MGAYVGQRVELVKSRVRDRVAERVWWDGVKPQFSDAVRGRVQDWSDVMVSRLTVEDYVRDQFDGGNPAVWW